MGDKREKGEKCEKGRKIAFFAVFCYFSRFLRFLCKLFWQNTGVCRVSHDKRAESAHRSLLCTLGVSGIRDVCILLPVAPWYMLIYWKGACAGGLS